MGMLCGNDAQATQQPTQPTPPHDTPPPQRPPWLHTKRVYKRVEHHVVCSWQWGDGPCNPAYQVIPPKTAQLCANVGGTWVSKGPGTNGWQVLGKCTHYTKKCLNGSPYPSQCGVCPGPKYAEIDQTGQQVDGPTLITPSSDSHFTCVKACANGAMLPTCTQCPPWEKLVIISVDHDVTNIRCDCKNRAINPGWYSSSTIYKALGIDPSEIPAKTGAMGGGVSGIACTHCKVPRGMGFVDILVPTSTSSCSGPWGDMM